MVTATRLVFSALPVMLGLGLAVDAGPGPKAASLAEALGQTAGPAPSGAAECVVGHALDALEEEGHFRRVGVLPVPLHRAAAETVDGRTLVVGAELEPDEGGAPAVGNPDLRAFEIPEEGGRAREIERPPGRSLAPPRLLTSPDGRARLFWGAEDPGDRERDYRVPAVLSSEYRPGEGWSPPDTVLLSADGAHDGDRIYWVGWAGDVRVDESGRFALSGFFTTSTGFVARESDPGGDWEVSTDFGPMRDRVRLVRAGEELWAVWVGRMEESAPYRTRAVNAAPLERVQGGRWEPALQMEFEAERRIERVHPLDGGENGFSLLIAKGVEPETVWPWEVLHLHVDVAEERIHRSEGEPDSGTEGGPYMELWPISGGEERARFLGFGATDEIDYEIAERSSSGSGRVLQRIVRDRESGLVPSGYSGTIMVHAPRPPAFVYVHCPGEDQVLLRSRSDP